MARRKRSREKKKLESNEQGIVISSNGRNPYHIGPGCSEGGQYTSPFNTGIHRTTAMKQSIILYTNNSAFQNEKEPENKRQKLVKDALYDGGYTKTKDQDISQYGNTEELESFLYEITHNSNKRKDWKDKKELVKTFVRVIRGYAETGNYDVIKGRSGSKNALFETLGLALANDDVVKHIMNQLIAQFDADDFCESNPDKNGKSVQMVFGPRIEYEGQIYDVYFKIILIPENGPHNKDFRNQYKVKILSFHEPEYPMKLLYTGEERMSRIDWAKPENADNEYNIKRIQKGDRK